VTGVTLGGYGGCNSQNFNKGSFQLLFTSHDTNLMDPAVMRRDQFYFAEKNQAHATQLYSLSDLKGIRNDADFARQYLGGYYGAVPMLNNLATMDATMEKTRPSTTPSTASNRRGHQAVYSPTIFLTKQSAKAPRSDSGNPEMPGMSLYSTK
jgi:hypothetical protein